MKMISKGFVSFAAATAMLATPTLAAAAPNPAASLSLSKSSAVRAAAPAGAKSKLGASVPGTTLISIGILAALTGIVLLVADNGDARDGCGRSRNGRCRGGFCDHAVERGSDGAESFACGRCRARNALPPLLATALRIR